MRALFLIGFVVCGQILAFAQQSVQLFNGKDLAGWVADVPAADKDTNVAPSFIVRSNLLVSMGNPGGHLITTREFRDYRLEVEYRFSGQGRELRRAGACFQTSRALRHVPPIH